MSERWVFRAFVCASSLPFDLDSIRSEREPKPDITCTMDGEPWAIEVTRVVHPGSGQEDGRRYARAKRTIVEAGPPTVHDERLALHQSIERKRIKNYDAGAGRPALLLYFDGANPHNLPPHWAQRVLDEEVEAHPGHWRAIWVFDEPKGEVLARR